MSASDTVRCGGGPRDASVALILRQFPAVVDEAPEAFLRATLTAAVLRDVQWDDAVHYLDAESVAVLRRMRELGMDLDKAEWQSVLQQAQTHMAHPLLKLANAAVTLSNQWCTPSQCAGMQAVMENTQKAVQQGTALPRSAVAQHAAAVRDLDAMGAFEHACEWAEGLQEWAAARDTMDADGATLEVLWSAFGSASGWLLHQAPPFQHPQHRPGVMRVLKWARSAAECLRGACRGVLMPLLEVGVGKAAAASAARALEKDALVHTSANNSIVRRGVKGDTRWNKETLAPLAALEAHTVCPKQAVTAWVVDKGVTRLRTQLTRCCVPAGVSDGAAQKAGSMAGRAKTAASFAAAATQQRTAAAAAERDSVVKGAYAWGRMASLHAQKAWLRLGAPLAAAVHAADAVLASSSEGADAAAPWCLPAFVMHKVALWVQGSCLVTQGAPAWLRPLVHSLPPALAGCPKMDVQATLKGLLSKWGAVSPPGGLTAAARDAVQSWRHARHLLLSVVCTCLRSLPLLGATAAFKLEALCAGGCALSRASAGNAHCNLQGTGAVLAWARIGVHGLVMQGNTAKAEEAARCVSRALTDAHWVGGGVGERVRGGLVDGTNPAQVLRSWGEWYGDNGVCPSVHCASLKSASVSVSAVKGCSGVLQAVLELAGVACERSGWVHGRGANGSKQRSDRLSLPHGPAVSTVPLAVRDWYTWCEGLPGGSSVLRGALQRVLAAVYTNDSGGMRVTVEGRVGAVCLRATAYVLRAWDGMQQAATVPALVQAALGAVEDTLGHSVCTSAGVKGAVESLRTAVHAACNPCLQVPAATAPGVCEDPCVTEALHACTVKRGCGGEGGVQRAPQDFPSPPEGSGGSGWTAAVSRLPRTVSADAQRALAAVYFEGGCLRVPHAAAATLEGISRVLRVQRDIARAVEDAARGQAAVNLVATLGAVDGVTAAEQAAVLGAVARLLRDSSVTHRNSVLSKCTRSVLHWTRMSAELCDAEAAESLIQTARQFADMSCVGKQRTFVQGKVGVSVEGEKQPFACCVCGHGATAAQLSMRSAVYRGQSALNTHGRVLAQVTCSETSAYEDAFGGLQVHTQQHTTVRHPSVLLGGVVTPLDDDGALEGSPRHTEDTFTSASGGGGDAAAHEEHVGGCGSSDDSDGMSEWDSEDGGGAPWAGAGGWRSRNRRGSRRIRAAAHAATTMGAPSVQRTHVHDETEQVTALRGAAFATTWLSTARKVRAAVGDEGAPTSCSAIRGVMEAVPTSLLEFETAQREAVSSRVQGCTPWHGVCLAACLLRADPAALEAANTVQRVLRGEAEDVQVQHVPMMQCRRPQSMPATASSARWVTVVATLRKRKQRSQEVPGASGEDHGDAHCVPPSVVVLLTGTGADDAGEFCGGLQWPLAQGGGGAGELGDGNVVPWHVCFGCSMSPAGETAALEAVPPAQLGAVGFLPGGGSVTTAYLYDCIGGRMNGALQQRALVATLAEVHGCTVETVTSACPSVLHMVSGAPSTWKTASAAMQDDVEQAAVVAAVFLHVQDTPWLRDVLLSTLDDGADTAVRSALRVAVGGVDAGARASAALWRMVTWKRSSDAARVGGGAGALVDKRVRAWVCISGDAWSHGGVLVPGVSTLGGSVCRLCDGAPAMRVEAYMSAPQAQHVHVEVDACSVQLPPGFLKRSHMEGVRWRVVVHAAGGHAHPVWSSSVAGAVDDVERGSLARPGRCIHLPSVPLHHSPEGGACVLFHLVAQGLRHMNTEATASEEHCVAQWAVPVQGTAAAVVTAMQDCCEGTRGTVVAPLVQAWAAESEWRWMRFTHAPDVHGHGAACPGGASADSPLHCKWKVQCGFGEQRGMSTYAVACELGCTKDPVASGAAAWPASVRVRGEEQDCVLWENDVDVGGVLHAAQGEHVQLNGQVWAPLDTVVRHSGGVPCWLRTASNAITLPLSTAAVAMFRRVKAVCAGVGVAFGEPKEVPPSAGEEAPPALPHALSEACTGAVLSAATAALPGEALELFVKGVLHGVCEGPGDLESTVRDDAASGGAAPLSDGDFQAHWLSAFYAATCPPPGIKAARSVLFERAAYHVPSGTCPALHNVDKAARDPRVSEAAHACKELFRVAVAVGSVAAGGVGAFEAMRSILSSVRGGTGGHLRDVAQLLPLLLSVVRAPIPRKHCDTVAAVMEAFSLVCSQCAEECDVDDGVGNAAAVHLREAACRTAAAAGTVCTPLYSDCSAGGVGGNAPLMARRRLAWVCSPGTAVDLVIAAGASGGSATLDEATRGCLQDGAAVSVPGLLRVVARTQFTSAWGDKPVQDEWATGCGKGGVLSAADAMDSGHAMPGAALQALVHWASTLTPAAAHATRRTVWAMKQHLRAVAGAARGVSGAVAPLLHWAQHLERQGGAITPSLAASVQRAMCTLELPAVLQARDEGTAACTEEWSRFGAAVCGGEGASAAAALRRFCVASVTAVVTAPGPWEVQLRACHEATVHAVRSMVQHGVPSLPAFGTTEFARDAHAAVHRLASVHAMMAGGADMRQWCAAGCIAACSVGGVGAPVPRGAPSWMHAGAALYSTLMEAQVRVRLHVQGRRVAAREQWVHKRKQITHMSLKRGRVGTHK